ncbi:hypothetical protein D3C74_487130 [compost metagenome]
MFTELDIHLKKLTDSDSSIEYAPHIRNEYENVVSLINEIRIYLGGSPKNIQEYFSK